MNDMPHKAICAVKGEAAGKLNRMSHIVLICRDMEETVRFYRDLLGLRVAATSGRVAQEARDRADTSELGKTYKRSFRRQYFFELANGELFGLYEVPDAPDGRDTLPLVNWIWPDCPGVPPERPMKLDHLAFNVETPEELFWFRDHLQKHGVKVFGPVSPKPGSTSPFTHRIYFFDPSGNPLEIATQNLADPAWKTIDAGFFLNDTEPVPSLTKA